MSEPPVHRFDSVASTMDLAHRLAEDGAVNGTAVVAAVQTAGRGSRGRAWHSPRGGLWLSVVLRPTAEASELLSLRAGLALAGALEAAVPALRVALKWPNDLLVEGRKLGGVLCEARWSGDAPGWAVIGAGVNVRNAVLPALGALRLADCWPDAEPDGVLDLVLPALRGLDTRAGRLGREELDQLARRDWLRGRRLAAPVAGTADGIAPEGALLVRGPGGTITALRSGSVTMADGPASS